LPLLSAVLPALSSHVFRQWWLYKRCISYRKSIFAVASHSRTAQYLRNRWLIPRLWPNETLLLSVN
jgi:hypothetical protein